MPPPASSRLAWLDLFRGACVVAMIATHVLNTFLATALVETAWFAWFTYFDGLVAPAFLFIAGYAQGLGMRQASAAPRAWGRKVRRLTAVWLLGYALHFPAPQLLAGHWSEALRLGTQVDVLQCLAVSLALLLAAERFARRWIDVLAALGLVLAVCVFREEPVQQWRFPPEWLLAYVNRSTGSLFPLVPWMGFVCAGFLASRVDASHLRLPTVAFLASLALAVLMPGSIGFFFHRLTWLLAAVPLVQWVASVMQPSWLLFAGRESLVLYAAHLLLIETLAVAGLTRHAHSLARCTLIFTAVLTAAVVIAVLWDRARRAGRRRGNSARAA